jgi:signal peptidase I
MMSGLTALLYAALAVYGVGWWLGLWIGNFSLLLFLLTLVTALFWFAERWRFAPARQAAADRFETEHAQRRTELQRQGIAQVDGPDLVATRERLLAQPWWLDWTAGLFPVILVVFVLRSFLFEPFKIPSGSMIPTLQVGDLILVSKFHYGVRLPVINTKIIDNHAPVRGDVIVFRYPLDTRIDYIKRIVGLPGDQVEYRGQRLFLNGREVPVKSLGDYYDEDSMRMAPRYTEQLTERGHDILVEPQRPSFFRPLEGFDRFRDNCRYSAEGVACTVPAGHYFVMGDNRDNSQDSRYWGFVPENNIVGRAFFVWMNFSNLKRIGAFH